MTMFPTPEQEAQSIQEGLEFTIRMHESRIALLERLIQKYATHVFHWAGVYYLETQFREVTGTTYQFTDEEWTEIRKIAKENE